jgi:ubiquinone/menaquinone biosynthesis C-methylase UbiE
MGWIMMSVVAVGDDRGLVWDEVAGLYGEGVSPFGFFSVELVEAARLCAGDRVLDLGTGNGLGLIPAARAVAPAVVVGIDLSQEMLDAAARRAASAGVANIELRCMDAARLEFPDESFDVALASSVFQFVGYSPDALREWRRVLRPGGRLVFSIPDAGTDPSMRMLMELISQHASKLPDVLAARLRSAQDSRRQPPDLSVLCRDSGFREVTPSRLELTTTVPDIDAWWDMQWSHGVRTFLRAFDPSTLEEIKREATVRLEALQSEAGTIPIVLTMAACHAVK